MKQVLYIGNVITMNTYMPRAQAVLVQDGIIQYVGSEKMARKLCNAHATIMDFNGYYIYPGFLEAHCHPLGAGRALDPYEMAHLSDGESLEEYLQIMKTFIKTHPGRRIYRGYGFVEREVAPTAKMLDEICASIPVVLTSLDAHSVWLNSKAMEVFGVDKQAIEKYGTELIRVDEKGKPTGYISEAPAFALDHSIPMKHFDGWRFLHESQDFFYKHGYTAVYDAGIELMTKKAVSIYHEAISKGDYKLRTFAGSIIDENCEDIDKAIKNIVHLQKQYNNEYFKIIGVKLFADGVTEAHTSLLQEDYIDKKGYKGLARMTNMNKLVPLYVAASKNNLSVHVHTIGDGASHIHLDAIEKASILTGKMDQRFALAHLQVVDPKDIQRMADLNVVAVTSALWAPKDETYPQEVRYIGKERADHCYPARSFMDAGAVTVFHTDFPISPNVSVPHSIYQAVKRRFPDQKEEDARNPEEALTRYQALQAMTLNVAYMWHEEDNMGSLEIGKIANMAIFDKDFLEDDLEDIYNASVVCTIVDGDIVYQSKDE